MDACGRPARLSLDRWCPVTRPMIKVLWNHVESVSADFLIIGPRSPMNRRCTTGLPSSPCSSCRALRSMGITMCRKSYTRGKNAAAPRSSIRLSNLQCSLPTTDTNAQDRLRGYSCRTPYRETNSGHAVANHFSLYSDASPSEEMRIVDRLVGNSPIGGFI